jgi:hypothetical protein
MSQDKLYRAPTESNARFTGALPLPYATISAMNAAYRAWPAGYQ